MLFGAFVFLVFQTLRGWRAGVIRAGIGLAALVFSSLLGWAAMESVSALSGGRESGGGMLAGAAIGAVVALAVYLAIWLAGALLFKRTAQHGSGMLRLAWGAGGACFGLLFGLLILWGGITIVRGLGALAEGRTRPGGGGGSPVAETFVTLKDSLEIGPTGSFFQKIDMVPPEAYDTIADVSRLVSDPRAMARFLEYPGIQDLINHPKILGLLNEPSILRAAETRNPLALVANPAILNLAKDPEIVAVFEKINFPEALRYALEKPAPAGDDPAR